VSDDDELRKRIAARNDGWKSAENAVEWNRGVIDRPAVANEHRIDTAAKSALEVVDEAVRALGLQPA
jgi:hypothetical protein